MPLTIDDLSEDRFLAGWRSLVGEAPAAMLDDRRAMIALLVETCPIALTDSRAGMPAEPVATPERRDRS